MKRPTKLSASERTAAMKRVSAWKLADRGRAIVRTFEFADFGEAFGFMARVALAADGMDHHPDWSNSYARVTIRLSTHDAGGLTENDFALAEKIDGIAG